MESPPNVHSLTYFFTIIHSFLRLDIDVNQNSMASKVNSVPILHRMNMVSFVSVIPFTYYVKIKTFNYLDLHRFKGQNRDFFSSYLFHLFQHRYCFQQIRRETTHTHIERQSIEERERENIHLFLSKI